LVELLLLLHGVHCDRNFLIEHLDLCAHFLQDLISTSDDTHPIADFLKYSGAVHMVCLCSVTRALLPCNIILCICSCSCRGCFSASCWTCCNFSCIFSMRVTSCVHAICISSICCSGSVILLASGKSGATFRISGQASASFSRTFSSLRWARILSHFSSVLHACSTNHSCRVSSAELSTSWSLFSSWSVEALISPNNCDAGHYTRFVAGGAASVGALVCMAFNSD
jgi:hypothetical protein